MRLRSDFFVNSFSIFVYLFIVFGVPNFDMMDLDIVQEEVVVKSKKPRKRKNTSSKVLKELIICLYRNQYSHMLKWSDDNKKCFEVTFVNKLSSKWKRKDISLFEHLDSLFKARIRPKIKYEENVKNRFKANMVKLSKYIKEIKPPHKKSKSVTIKYYEIFYLPENVILEIENILRNKSYEDKNKRNNATAIMENGSNLADIGENQNNFISENTEMVINDVIMENGNNLADIGENQNNFICENAEMVINDIMLESDELSNLGATGGNKNKLILEKNNEKIINVNNVQRDERAIDGNPINPFNTFAEDYIIPNNVLPTFQMNTDYNSLKRHLFFNELEDNEKNIKEKIEVRLKTFNDDAVTPSNTFVEDLNIPNIHISEMNTDYSVLNLYEESVFSRDYEGNMKFESENKEDKCLKNYFQLPEVESSYVDTTDNHGLPGFAEIRNSRMSIQNNFQDEVFDEKNHISSNCEF